MQQFTVEESNLICIYAQGSRLDLIQDLTEMMGYLTAEEKSLHELSQTVIAKLHGMTDEEYDALLPTLQVDFLPGELSCEK